MWHFTTTLWKESLQLINCPLAAFRVVHLVCCNLVLTQVQDRQRGHLSDPIILLSGDRHKISRANLASSPYSLPIIMLKEMALEFGGVLSAILKGEILEDSVRPVLLELAVDFICMKELFAPIIMFTTSQTMRCLFFFQLGQPGPDGSAWTEGPGICPAVPVQQTVCSLQRGAWV